MIVDVLLEGRVAQVAPEHRGHAHFVRRLEGLRHLDDLAPGFGRAEVDGGADRHRAHVARLLDAGKKDLVELVGVGQELVVVELEQERNLVRVLARAGAQHAEGRGHRVAATLDGQLDDVFGVEVQRIFCERGAGAVLDALVDRQDRQIAAAA